MVISNTETEMRETLSFNTDSSPSQDSPPPNTVKDEHAIMMAEMYLGVANNFIEIGGGFFIKIKMHDSFKEYEELVQVIEDQNQKNIRRLKLDEDDKAMLRPLLAAVLKQRGKVVTPEQQLLIAGVSILIKKAQLVMEMRAENMVLFERIKEMISDSKEAEVVAPVEPQRSEPVGQVEKEQDSERLDEVEIPSALKAVEQMAEEQDSERLDEMETASESESGEEKQHSNRAERRRAEREAQKLNVQERVSEPEAEPEGPQDADGEISSSRGLGAG